MNSIKFKKGLSCCVGVSDLQQALAAAEAGHVEYTWPMEAAAKVKMPTQHESPFLNLIEYIA